ncbi:MAG TPA: selenocysteine-specific translation elongation factor [Candidatus Limnocylindrales bacterium]
MTVVVGTAGHIDHGKTTLLRALTGIDADRLPEEQRRGMTIDVGYAHLDLDDGSVIDFVDVPGHDRLVGNMLVGTGEIDAALLVVAADDGPRAQTLEHLALLDGLGITNGIVAVTKVDAVPDERVAEVVDLVGRLLARTTLAGSPIVPVASVLGLGLDELRAGLLALRDRTLASRSKGHLAGPPRLAIDRVFVIRGHGTVVTGSLRGGGSDASGGGSGLVRGATARIEPDGLSARVRGIEARNAAVERVVGGGRTALNLGGIDAGALRRGMVVTIGRGVEVSDRLLVALRGPAVLGPLGPERGAHGAQGVMPNGASWPPRDGARARLHIGTEAVDARLGRSGRDAADLPGGRSTAILRLVHPIAVAIGDRFVLRRPSPGEVLAGGVVLDPLPARGVARRRTTPERLADLASAVAAGDPDAISGALVALHGALPTERVGAVSALFGEPAALGSVGVGDVVLAPDVADALKRRVVALVVDGGASPVSAAVPVADVRRDLAAALRRSTGLVGTAAASASDRVIDDLVDRGRLVRDRDRLVDPARAPGLPAALEVAMARLEALLDVNAPPGLAAASAEAGCPPDGVRALESAGRIVRVDLDLAYSGTAYRRLVETAVSMAAGVPLTPAALRDATGTSRKYVMALIEDFDRRGILRRTPDGHVPGRRGPEGRAPDAPAPDGISQTTVASKR